MPKRVWLSLTALLYYRTSASCMALAEGLQTVSHDSLTRLVQAAWSGQTLLELAWRTLFVCERGDLIVDDTVLPKPFATAIEGLAWMDSSQERKPVYGLSLVLLVWTNGALRVPVGIRLWRRGGASKYALAFAQLCPQPPALSARVRVVRRLVSVDGAAEADSGRWLVFCVSPEEEPPVQWPRGPSASAAPLLGRGWLLERRAQSAGCQTRQKVLCHQPLDVADRRGPPPVSRSRPN
jgi:hypothetical protein